MSSTQESATFADSHKFVPDEISTPLLLRALDPLLDLLGTRVTRKLGPILAGSGLHVIHDLPVGLRGFFRIILTNRP